MKVAIVGTTAILSEDEQLVMKREIALVLKKYSLDTIIISGGAKGVDTFALEIAKYMGFKTQEYKPEINEWIPSNGKIGHKKRNLQIANDCDELYCFSVGVSQKKYYCYHHKPPQKHKKTAGCWTLDKAKQMNKTCLLVVLSN